MTVWQREYARIYIDWVKRIREALVSRALIMGYQQRINLAIYQDCMTILNFFMTWTKLPSPYNHLYN